MAKHYLTVRCKEEGCKEFVHYEYPNKTEYREAVTRHKDWKCTRHSEYGKSTIMSTEILLKEKTLINSKGHNNDFLYWKNEDGKLESGFQHGPGFRVWSKDFPEGAILKITAEIILPD